MIIPKVLRPEMLSKIHSSHQLQGIVPRLPEGKDVVYRPGMSAEIKALVEKCHICAAFHTRNSR